MNAPLLELRGVKRHFAITKGVVLRRVLGTVKAVDGVSFAIPPGKTFGLIGESGCGKTTTAKLVLRLERPSEGSVLYKGRDVWNLDEAELRELRCTVQAVFQDPYGSLNPRMRVRDIVSEPLRANDIGTPASRAARVAELLALVGLQPSQAGNFPHEFSGGQRQRIALARAIASNPSLVVLDEPVSALDVSIRAQMMNLLRDIQEKLGLAYLLIAHDLAVIEHMSDQVGVMYLGKLVELCAAEALYGEVGHPYTRALLSAAMPSHPREAREPMRLSGEVPSPVDPPAGCRFHPRCPRAMPECGRLEPPLVEVEPGHWIACHLYPAPAGSGSREAVQI